MNQYLSTLNPTERRFVVGVAMLLFVIINLFWIWPHFSDWENLQLRLRKARQKLADYQAVIDQAPRLRAEMKKLEGISVPREDQTTELFGRIQNEAIRCGVNTTVSRKPNTRTNQFFIEVFQTVTVDSGEKQLVDFLYNLGAGSSLIRVQGLSVRPDVPRQKLNATITFVATFQKNQAARTRRSADRAEPAKVAPAEAAPTGARPAGRRIAPPPRSSRRPNPTTTKRK